MGQQYRFGAPFTTLNSSRYGKLGMILFALSLPDNGLTLLPDPLLGIFYYAQTVQVQFLFD